MCPRGCGVINCGRKRCWESTITVDLGWASTRRWRVPRRRNPQQCHPIPPIIKTSAAGTLHQRSLAPCIVYLDGNRLPEKKNQKKTKEEPRIYKICYSYVYQSFRRTVRPRIVDACWPRRHPSLCPGLVCVRVAQPVWLRHEGTWGRTAQNVPTMLKGSLTERCSQLNRRRSNISPL